MKIKYQVVDVTREGRESVQNEYDTEEQALAYIENIPEDLLGTVVFTIRKVWTNSSR